MKLIICIIRDVDYDSVTSSLTSAGFRVTCIASTGGFWRKGNSTLLIGLDDDKVEQALNIIRTSCTAPVEPATRRATIFVLNVANFLHI
jgi:uncharacterized protein YaaQ